MLDGPVGFGYVCVAQIKRIDIPHSNNSPNNDVLSEFWDKATPIGKTCVLIDPYLSATQCNIDRPSPVGKRPNGTHRPIQPPEKIGWYERLLTL